MGALVGQPPQPHPLATWSRVRPAVAVAVGHATIVARTRAAAARPAGPTRTTRDIEGERRSPRSDTP
jgi:hypothetical protein